MAAYVTLYEGKNYTGKSVILPVGDYPTNESGNFANDKINSVKVPAGLVATVYQDEKYKGKSYDLTSDIADLSLIGFGNMLSSIKVKAKDTTTGSTTIGDTTSSTTPGKGKISTIGWIAIVFGSLVVIGGGILLAVKLSKKKQ